MAVDSNADSPSPLALRHEGDVAVITLSRPAVLNAIDAAMREAVRATLQSLAHDPAVAAVVITGAGRAFSAGQDLTELAGLDASSAQRWIRDLGALYVSVREFAKPTVAAINGIAAGGGFQVALHCDLRIGSAFTRMAQTEINVGLPSVLGPWVMQRVMGIGPTVDMTLTGRVVDSAECVSLGLLHRVVDADRLVEEAVGAARALAAKSPLALAMSKAWIGQLGSGSFAEAIDTAADMVAQAFASGDPQQRIAAFLAQRRERPPG